jgi:hypothetical protein
MRKRLLILVLVGVMGCKGGDDPKPATAAAAGPPTTPAPVAAKANAPAPAAELSPKIKAARCGEPCLFLVDTPIDQLIATYKAECGGMDTKDLGYADCKQLDYVRNCIYAAHGLVFKQKRWRVWKSKPWYEARADFQAKSISPVELANVRELNARGKACKKGVRVSPEDLALVRQWSTDALAGKVAAPPVIEVEEDPATPQVLAEFVQGKALVETRLDLSRITVYYEPIDGPLVANLMQRVKAPAGAKLRAIILDTGQETGDLLRFIYTDKNELVAVAAQFYISEGEE